MSIHKQELEKRLCAIANELRCNMGANEFREYILGVIFFKFLSGKMKNFVMKELEGECESFLEVLKDPELMEGMKEGMWNL